MSGSSASKDGLHGELMTRSGDLAGRYRLKYYGDAKGLGGSVTPFEGVSGEFELL